MNQLIHPDCHPFTAAGNMPVSYTHLRWQQDLATRSISNNLEAEGLFHTGSIEHRVLFGVEVANQDRTPDLYTTLARGPGAQPVPSLDLYDLSLIHISGRWAGSAWRGTTGAIRASAAPRVRVRGTGKTGIASYL